jgi:3-keto-disaccharide hydrolase
MTRWATFIIALLFVGALHYADTAAGQDGWVALFDGKNLDQWDAAATPEVSYSIEDGSIVANKKDPKKDYYLVSKQSFKNFQLRAEFWVSNDANSGIFIRCEDPKKPGARTCYECNIFDTRPDPSYGTGAIVFHAEVNPMPKAGGKWSTMEITANGRDLSIMFDGQKTAQVRNSLHTEGPIALQFGVGTIKFRKVQIKPL